MSTRETFTVRLSADEKDVVKARASSYGMTTGEFMRYAALTAPPPAPSQGLPSYSALASTVQSMASTVQTHDTMITNLASSNLKGTSNGNV